MCVCARARARALIEIIKKRIRKVYFKLEHEKYIIEKVHLYIILRK